MDDVADAFVDNDANAPAAAARNCCCTSGTAVTTARITTAVRMSVSCLGTSAFTAKPPCDNVANNSDARRMPSG